MNEIELWVLNLSITNYSNDIVEQVLGAERRGHLRELGIDVIPSKTFGTSSSNAIS